jgi:hypothetical protein
MELPALARWRGNRASASACKLSYPWTASSRSRSILPPFLDTPKDALDTLIRFGVFLSLLASPTVEGKRTVGANSYRSNPGLVTGHHAHAPPAFVGVVGRWQVLVRVVWPYQPFRSDFGPRDSEAYGAGIRSPCRVRLPSVPTQRTSGNGSVSPLSLYPRGLVRRVSDTWPGCRVLASPSVTPSRPMRSPPRPIRGFALGPIREASPMRP